MATTILRKQRLDKDTTVVAHSAGAELINRFLTENTDVMLEQLHLVAPWRAEGGKYNGFSEYEIDPHLPRRAGRVVVYSSLDDSERIQKNAAMLRELWPGINYREFRNYGHFMLGNNMTSPEFPELLEEIVVD